MSTQVFEHSAENLHSLANLFQQVAQGGDSYTECMRSLSQLDTFLHFRPGLLRIGIQPEYPLATRTFALSYLKNTLSDFWKRKRNISDAPMAQPHPMLAASGSSSNQMSQLQQQASQFIIDEKEPDRATIKEMLLAHLFTEPETSIVNLLSDVISKIAAFDFPYFWPEFVPGLINALRSATETVAKFNSQVASLSQYPIDITPIQSELRIAKRSFDTLELLLSSFVSRKLNSHLLIVDHLILRPHFFELFSMWNEYSTLLTNIIAPNASSPSSSSAHATHHTQLAVEQLKQSSSPYAKSFELLHQSVVMGIKALGHCVNCKAESLFGLPNNFVDHFFSTLGNTLTLYRQCIGSTQITSLSSSSLPTPSHHEPCLGALNNSLRSAMGDIIGVIHDTLSSTPLLFSSYLVPFLDLFLTIIHERAEERQRETEMLSMEHAQGEIGIGWEDDIDDLDIRLKGGDSSVINAFRFLATVLNTPAYQREVQSAVQMGVIMKQSEQQQLGINPEQLIMDANKIARENLTDEMLTRLGHTIITGYLGLSRYDYKLLSSYYPPDDTELCEQFYHQQSEFSVTEHELPACMAVLQMIFKNNNNVMMSLIESLYCELVVNQNILYVDNQNSEAIRRSWSYDNMILVISTFLFDIKDNIDPNRLYELTMQSFQSFLTQQQQSQQAQNATQRHFLYNATVDNGYGVHTTRFLRLIELCSNLTEICSPDQLAQLWAMLTPFLHYGNSAVQLTTVNTIKCIADSYNFEHISRLLSQTQSQFPHSSDAQHAASSVLLHTLESLVHICNASSDSSSKDLILVAIRLTIRQQDESALLPLIPLLLQSLSLLWRLTDQQRHIRSKIIDIFNSITVTLNKNVLMLEDVLADIIKSTTILSDNPANDHSAYIESSLDLWLNVLRHVPSLTPKVLDLFPNWLGLYHDHDDFFFEYGVLILQSYMLLDPQPLFTQHREQILYILLRIAQKYFSHLTLKTTKKKTGTAAASAGVTDDDILDLTVSSGRSGGSRSTIEDNMITIIDLFSFIAQLSPDFFFMTKPSQNFLLSLLNHTFGYFDKYYHHTHSNFNASPSNGDVIDHHSYTNGSSKLTSSYYNFFSILAYKSFDPLATLLQSYHPTSPIQEYVRHFLLDQSKQALAAQYPTEAANLQLDYINLGLYLFFNNFTFIFELVEQPSVRKYLALAALNVLGLPYHRYCYCYHNINQLFTLILTEVADDEVPENRYKHVAIESLVINPHATSDQFNPNIVECYEDIRAAQVRNANYSNNARLKTIVREKLQHAATVLQMQSMCEALANSLPQNLHQVLMND